MATAEELKAFFADVGDDKKTFAYDAIDEYLFFQNQVEKLKQLPLIRYSKKNPERQQLTPAARLIKEYSQVMDAKRNILLRILNSMENSATEELLAKLSEFE